MIITHASAQKIDYISDYHNIWCLIGTLCCGEEGNMYNLSSKVRYQYNFEVDSTIRVGRFFYEHELSEPAVQEVFKEFRWCLEQELPGVEMTDEEISELLDDSESVFSCGYFEDAENIGYWGWFVQQLQGMLAHKLGYDCAVSTDEQGTVYLKYLYGQDISSLGVEVEYDD